MGMEPRYKEMIEQLEAMEDQLDEWETGFVFGDMDNPDPKKRRRPMRDNTFLTQGRKDKIEELYTKRVLQQKWKRKSKMKFGIIEAKLDKERGYTIRINEIVVGEGMSRKEASAVAPWIHGALTDILSLPASAVKAYAKGTPIITDEEPTKPVKKKPATKPVAQEADPDCGF